MGASDNVGSAASGGGLAGQVGLASTVGRAEWLAARRIRPSKVRGPASGLCDTAMGRLAGYI